MKRILFCLSVVISFFIIGCVKAETFTEGAWINGEYINKVKDGRINYLTAQFINDSSGDTVYCLEPFVEFQNGSDYVKYEDGFENHLNLTSEQVRRVKLLGYYGYGYGSRTESKWYVITQYLIWKVIDPAANIYFTDKLNGKRIDKYTTEIAELQRDVEIAMTLPSFSNYYEIPYKEGITITDNNNVLSNYSVKSSDYDYALNGNSFEIKNVMIDGKVVFKQNFNNRYNSPAIYLHASSQKLFKVGKPDELEKEINIKSISGSILLDIKDDDSVYTVESEFSNVCYTIYDKNDQEVDNVCTNQEMKYKTGSLELGEYYVKQISTGVGYRKDENIYKVVITKENLNQTVELKNVLIRNDIEIDKKYCKNDVCSVEPNAVFDVYDKNETRVKELVTDNNGEAKITLGYGGYMLRQTKGMEGYSFADDIHSRIVNETDKLRYSINNNYIETKVEYVKEVVEEVAPPDTRADNYLVRIGQLIRNMCYIFGKNWKKC